MQTSPSQLKIIYLSQLCERHRILSDKGVTLLAAHNSSQYDTNIWLDRGKLDSTWVNNNNDSQLHMGNSGGIAVYLPFLKIPCWVSEQCNRHIDDDT